ncbi:hypothetical protein EDC04DRAFT_2815830 [Pisolithus marmoratus]|nr:hypothetical protein EDC04DRAFT_2815830 [Pisolithus marmoratus]
MWASNRNRSSLRPFLINPSGLARDRACNCVVKSSIPALLVLVLSTSSATLQRLNIRTSHSLSMISVQDQSTRAAATDTLDSAAQEKGSLLKASHFTGQKLMMFRLLGQMVVQDRPLTGPSGRPTCHGENTFVGMSNASSAGNMVLGATRIQNSRTTFSLRPRAPPEWWHPVQASNPHSHCRATAENR